MTEGDLQRATLDLAKTLGWRVARFPAANYVRKSNGQSFVLPLAHDTKGYPDVSLVRERFVVAEFKAEKKKLSPEQAVWRDALENAGVEYHLWRPEDWVSGAIEAALA